MSSPLSILTGGGGGGSPSALSPPLSSKSRKNAVFLGNGAENKFQELFLSSPRQSPTLKDRTPRASPSSRSISAATSPLASLSSSHKSQQLSPGASSFSSGAESPLNLSYQQLMLREQLSFQQQARDRSVKRALIAGLEKRDQMRDLAFEANSNSYEESRTLLDEIDAQLSLQMESKRTKTRRQFEDWNENVHGKIQSRINEQINAISPQELHARRNKDYAKFLEIINRKQTVFREIIIESEYDPLEVNLRSVKVRTGRLKDPTNIDAQKLEEETLKSDSHSPKSPKKQLSRVTLNVEEWANGKIQATPFGRKVGTDEDGLPSPAKPRNKNSLSSVVLDHFRYPVGEEGRAALAKELPKGKATSPKRIYANPRDAFPAPDAIDDLIQYSPT